MPRQTLDVDMDAIRKIAFRMTAKNATALLNALGLEGFGTGESESAEDHTQRLQSDSKVQCSGSRPADLSPEIEEPGGSRQSIV